jgi:hypothetical protein
MASCGETDCLPPPASIELLNRMLADLGFIKGEAGQKIATDDTQQCRYRFPSVHLGVVCGKDQVRVVQQNTVLVEQPMLWPHDGFAVRFRGIVALGTWTDGYEHQTVTGLQVLRASTIP